MDPQSLLRIKQILGDRKAGTPGLVPISASQWWRLVSEGKIERPIKLSPRVSVWRASYIATLADKLGAGGK